MKKELRIVNTGYGIEIKQIPIECPYCYHAQMPSMYSAFKTDGSAHFIFCVCTNSHCRHAFIILYDNLNQKFSNIKQAALKVKEFNKIIKELSPLFCEIYNEAYSAEQMGLNQIMGVGYRKALEFLIKDYLISTHPEKEEEIKNKFLGRCINDDVADQNIKDIVKRATWLGNDETHYIRKWRDKDVSHLKGLIDLCLHWIEAEINTKKILEEMPE